MRRLWSHLWRIFGKVISGIVNVLLGRRDQRRNIPTSQPPGRKEGVRLGESDEPIGGTSQEAGDELARGREGSLEASKTSSEPHPSQQIIQDVTESDADQRSVIEVSDGHCAQSQSMPDRVAGPAEVSANEVPTLLRGNELLQEGDGARTVIVTSETSPSVGSDASQSITLTAEEASNPFVEGAPGIAPQAGIGMDSHRGNNGYLRDATERPETISGDSEKDETHSEETLGLAGPFVATAEIGSIGPNQSIATESRSEEFPRAQPRMVVEKVPRPRPSEDTGEYAVAAAQLTASPDDYRLWNRAIAEHLLLGESSSGGYLTVTPRVLAHVLEAEGETDLSPEEAEVRFGEAVSRMYNSRVLGHGARLRVLRRFGDDGMPECIGFLALSVLAAYRMHSDEDAAGHAYYVRLADLLNCKLSGTYPVGFDPIVFESLWLFVKSWLERRTGVRLVVPGPDESGHRRYVALPLAHVPLRCLDIEKLADFFSWAGYKPGEKIPPERVLADLSRWDRSRSALTAAGAAALADSRRGAVLAQVLNELESWDGSIVESAGRRTATVELMLDIVQRRPDLFYLPRRPTGFPKIFDNGKRVFECTDEGWYDPMPIDPQDGALLVDGFEWLTTVNGVQVVLRRTGAQAIAFAPSEYSSFLSNRSLLRGVRCAVLCRERLAEPATSYLSEVSRQSCRAILDPGLPSGWCLFTNVVPQRSVGAPSGLEALEVDSIAEVVLSGGLRLGKRAAWLAGAPPQMFVSGLESGDRPTIDGEAVGVSSDGSLELGDRLRTPGIHVVEAARVQRRLEIVEPELPLVAVAARPSARRSNHVIALPQGDWTVIGAMPGEVSGAQYRHSGGSLARCSFKPVWAIRVGANRGATVAAVAPLVAPTSPRRKLSPQYRVTPGPLEVWAGTIYQANIRRPQFCSLAEELAQETIIPVWKEYVVEAKRVKRAMKRR